MVREAKSLSYQNISKQTGAEADYFSKVAFIVLENSPATTL
jgi:hypothetical protein